MPKSSKAKSLTLRRAGYYADARVKRKIDARHSKIIATPDGRFFFGQQWTPELINKMARSDGFVGLDAAAFNRLPLMFSGQAH